MPLGFASQVEGGGGGVDWDCHYTAPLCVKVDPQLLRFGPREAYFARQRFNDWKNAARLNQNDSDEFCCDGIPVAVKCA
jgi:hypothetical protein